MDFDVDIDFRKTLLKSRWLQFVFSDRNIIGDYIAIVRYIVFHFLLKDSVVPVAVDAHFTGDNSTSRYRFDSFN